MLLRDALARFYDRLTRNDPVAPADIIIVMAGSMERKRYGIALYRSGIAPRLLLSVARFEVSKMRLLESPEIDAGELFLLRDRTPPRDRHFFLDIDERGCRIERVPLPAWNTWGESVGIERHLNPKAVRRAMVVSTGAHLERVARAFARVFGKQLEFSFCAVPDDLSSVHREGWWTRSEDRRFVLKEAAKLAGYRLILPMPDPLIRRLMSLGPR